MNWKLKEKIIKPEPKLGDTRSVKKFAFFPTKTDDLYFVWLEKYWACQEYSSFSTGYVISEEWNTKEKYKFLTAHSSSKFITEGN